MAQRIGVLGSGVVGQTLGDGFLRHGYEVMLGSRDPRKAEVRDWAGKHPGGKSGTFEQTAQFGELLVVACLGQAVESVIALAGRANCAGKAVIDTCNPIAEAAPVNGVLQFTTGPNESLGEKLQALLPDAHVVKAFNSVGATLMVNPKFETGTPTMFLCGDDTEAKRRVSDIVAQFGWEPFDCGGIAASRALEPLCMLWCIPGFLRNQWTHAFKLLTR